MAPTLAQFVALSGSLLGLGLGDPGTTTSPTATTPKPAINKTAPSLGFPQALQQSWAQYSPWFAVGVYEDPPLGCEVVQVNLLQRHGARYPEKGPSKAIQKSLKKLKRVKTIQDPSLDFIKDYVYDLGLDDLVPFGAAQSFDAGQEHFVRYASLVDEDTLPFVRASESDRVIDSARNWTAGFAHASGQRYVPELSVIISQLTNDTLDDKMCPQATTKASDHATKKWTDVFAPPIVDRLNTALPGAKLKKHDIVNLMSLCPFDTVAHEAPSPWCNVFTEEEWAAYEYHGDLLDYYGNGYGQPLGRVQGVGYVNELLSRLLSHPIQDATQTNHTLDDSPFTFPLDRSFYADFSHDNQMISIFGALGLFEQERELEGGWMDEGRTWVDSRMVPFSGRMVVEKIECRAEGRHRHSGPGEHAGNGEHGGHRQAGHGEHAGHRQAETKRKGEYVRVLVNDAVQPLTFCGAKEDGMCPLVSFVQSQHYARNNGEGDWELCFSPAGSK